MVINGQIHLPAHTHNFSGATVYVRLENIGMMDAPATIAEQVVLRNFSYSGNSIPFSIKTESSGANVRVHISMDGSDEFEKGDYITKQSYPAQANMTIQLEKI